MIHRDLKPENILPHEGQPLVANFGIALAVTNAGGNRITQTGPTATRGRGFRPMVVTLPSPGARRSRAMS